jgi:quinol monooxygenase YgiN
MIQFIIPYKAAPGTAEKMKRAVYRFVRNVNDREPGTLTYRSLQYIEDPTRFIHVLIFTSLRANEIQRDSLYLRQFIEGLYPLCSEKVIKINASALV